MSRQERIRYSVDPTKFPLLEMNPNAKEALSPVQTIFEKEQLHDAFGRVADDVGRTLGLDFQRDSLHFWTPDHVYYPSKFLFAISERTNGPTGFIKIAGGDEAKAQLRRESASLQVATELGFPTVPYLSAYIETPAKRAIIESAFISGDDAEHIGFTYENVAALPGEYGKKIAKSLIPRTGTEIPSTIDISHLSDTNPRATSMETFLPKYHEDSEAFFSSENRSVLNTLLGREDGVEWMGKLLQSTEEEVKPLIAQGEGNGFVYCVDDVRIDNFFFPKQWGEGQKFAEPVVYFDLEFGGKTKNRTLALLRDISLFYARCAPNPILQREFLKTTHELNPMGNRSDTHDLLKSAVVVGTSVEGNKLNPADSRHWLSKSVMQNLEPNLQWLEDFNK
jgi:hypothetical protein